DRFEKYLKEEGVLDEEKIEELEEEIEEQVDQAVEEAESVEAPDLSDMFDYMYEEKPPRLEEQLERLKEVEEE
ncbi:MAG: thiamine pyrophosphate-dependent enzyme, partial [Candidatus Nanohaloarchaea archaeon]